ncbi:MAG TPA: hypothetical protein VFG10_17600 [Saprospiraceae bacterium]|nr:hypothetical protein [Saprospiraceae bacterium]
MEHKESAITQNFNRAYKLASLDRSLCEMIYKSFKDTESPIAIAFKEGMNQSDKDMKRGRVISKDDAEKIPEIDLNDHNDPEPFIE